MSESNFAQFKSLHFQEYSLVFNNIWDLPGAIIQEKQGAKAVATSSAAMAWSLGYADGYQLPQALLLETIARIQSVISIPLSVDIENGYSDDINEVVSLVRALNALDVAGINIEDGASSPALLCDKIRAIKEAVPALFVNARTDVYLAQLVPTELQEKETETRLQHYLTAGCDGVFIPGLNDVSIASDWQTRLNSDPIGVPVNLMATDSNQVESFQKAGIKRISSGPVSFINAYNTLLSSQNGPFLSYDTLNGYF